MFSTDLIYEVGRKHDLQLEDIFTSVCFVFVGRNCPSAQVFSCANVFMCLCVYGSHVFTKQEPLCSHIADADVNLMIAISLTVIGADCPNCRTPLTRIFLYLSADRASQQ